MALRRIWIAALALGLIALSAALSQAATPNKYLPDDTEFVLRVNVKDLLETEIVKKNALEPIKAGLRENLQLGLIFETLNFDPLKDLQTITLAGKDLGANLPMGGGNGGGARPRVGEVFAVIHGAFDLDKFHKTLADAAKENPAKLAISDYSGFKVYEGKENENPVFVAFLDKTTAVASNKKNRVTEAIDVSTGKRKANPSRTLVNMLAKVSESQAVIMALPLPKNARESMMRNPQTMMIAEKLEGMTGSVAAGKDATAEIHLHTTDAQFAMQFRQQIEALKLLAAGAIMGQGFPGGDMLAELVENMKTNADGKVVALKLSLTQEMIDKAKKGDKDK
jgi:hypothetical protein